MFSTGHRKKFATRITNYKLDRDTVFWNSV